MVASVSFIFLKRVVLGTIDVTVPTTVAWAPGKSEDTAAGAPYVSQSKGRVRSKSRTVLIPSLFRRFSLAVPMSGTFETGASSARGWTSMLKEGLLLRLPRPSRGANQGCRDGCA